MARLISLKTFTDDRGNLTVLDRVIPFDIVRVYYIYGVDNSERGGHRHHKTRQAAVCIQGSCSIYNNDGANECHYELNSPDKCLVLEPVDWHVMYNFSSDAILMVFASEPFSAEDYIYESYPNSLRRP